MMSYEDWASYVWEVEKAAKEKILPPVPPVESLAQEVLRWRREAAILEPEHIESLCSIMHNAYEIAAGNVGWETNAQSRVPWDLVPEENKVAMRAGVYALLEELLKRGVYVDSN
jgi:hypothetical protein